MNKRLVKKRTFNNQRSKLKRRIKNGAKIPKKILIKYHLKKRYRELYIRGKNTESKRSRLNISVPKSLSFIESQDETINFLNSLEKKLSSETTAYDLYIDHTETVVISIDASFLFDKIINKYVKKWKKNRIHIILSGKTSKSREINNFLLSFGFFSHINIITKQICPKDADFDYKKRFILFQKSGNAKLEYLAGNACTELTEFFDKCFKANGFSINDEAKGYLIDIFGEIIRNTEEHSSNNSDDWNVIGCYSKEKHVCSFSIINKGNSFYESLSAINSKASYALSEVDDILLKHRGFISKLTGGKEKYIENIWTMMALQDGISSKRTEFGKSSSRGLGMMDIISFIDSIRNKQEQTSHLKIISGRSSIFVDYSYPVLKKEKEQRRSMIFNNEQNLHLPPDKRYINSLDGKFPGTIISADFLIDPMYLLEKINGV